jgi:hypothetical protein
MKIKSLFVAVLLMAGVVVAPANANEKPAVESFTFSPQEIDLSGSSTTINFQLVISHPAGIENNSTILTVTNSRGAAFATYLTRVESDAKASKVTFKGVLDLPRNISPGVYKFSVAGVKNNSTSGYQYETGLIESSQVRSLVGAENAILVRSNGNLNFDYSTFVGPTYLANQDFSFIDTKKFNSTIVPIWKVGETYDPNLYFESRVPGLDLSVNSTTPSICSSDGKFLKFLNVGSCSFKVSTSLTKDYLAKISTQSEQISAARIKPTLVVDKIADQDVKNLGKLIEIGNVYSASEGYVLPETLTPSVCFASGFYVKLIAGGTCKLTYQTNANANYLASDLYTVSFEILKDGKPVVAPTPTATPTPTAKPVVKKTITCVKGKKTVKRTGTSPKCPAGYKLKK